MRFRVIVNVYSGRPNPEVTLSGEQALEFAEATAQLVPAPEPPPEPPALGYRGFEVVELDDDAAGGENVTHYVFGGAVRLGGEVLSDPGRTAERWLLDQTESFLDSSVVAHIRSSLDAT